MGGYAPGTQVFKIKNIQEVPNPYELSHLQVAFINPQTNDMYIMYPPQLFEDLVN